METSDQEAFKSKSATKQKRYYQNKRAREQSILKKARDVLSQNKEMSLEENDIVRKAEEIKANQLKKKQYVQNRKAAATPEESEAKRLKIREQSRQFRQTKREKEETILKKAMELLSQNQVLSSKENGIVGKAEEIKAERLKLNEKYKQYRRKRKAVATPEEIEANRLKRLEQNRRSRQNRKNAATLKKREEVEEEFRFKTLAGWLSEDKVTSKAPLAIDEIKIEEEVFQESTIKAVPLRQNVNPILDEQLNSSCSWLELSESFITGENSQSITNFPSFYGGSSSVSESFANRNGHSTKIYRRKSGLEESFRCMRELIDARAKRDELVVFGKQIAQKLRTSKKDVPELSIAKQLIDKILQNFAIGAYNSNTEIV